MRWRRLIGIRCNLCQIRDPDYDSARTSDELMAYDDSVNEQSALQLLGLPARISPTRKGGCQLFIR